MVGTVGYQSSPISFDWATIPAGYFQMGSDRNRDSLAAANEEGQRLYLPEYKIGYVPVTVAQFRHYVTAMHPPTTAEVNADAQRVKIGRHENLAIIGSRVHRRGRSRPGSGSSRLPANSKNGVWRFPLYMVIADRCCW